MRFLARLALFLALIAPAPAFAVPAANMPPFSAKEITTPSLKLQGPITCTSILCNGSSLGVVTPGVPAGQTLDTFLASLRKSVLDYIPSTLHAGIVNRTGTADVTPYLNAALNSGWRDLLIPPGLYPTTCVAITTPNHRIFAHGAHIRAALGTNCAGLRVFTPANGVYVYGGDWQGSGAQSYTLPPDGYHGGAVYFGGVTDVGIEGSTVREGMSCGICFEGVERYHARNNYVSRVYFGPGIGSSYANFGMHTGNVTTDTVAEGLTIDNTSHDNIVQGNRLSNIGFQLSGQTIPNGVGYGCFGGIGAGASSNNNVFDSNIITHTSCSGIGFSGKNNRITDNIITDVVLHGIYEQYYSGNKPDGSCCITSDQGGNTIASNSFNQIGSGIGVLLEHDTGANVVGPNNWNGTRVGDATNGTQGNVFVNESGTLFVNSPGSAALTARAFGKYVQVTGASDWQPTLPPADQQAGARIEFFCNSVAQTIKPPAGAFGGPYGGGVSTKACPPGATLTFRSDGFSWQVVQYAAP